MRVIIPEFKTKSELFAHLKANRKSIIAQKCSMPVKSDDGENEPFNYGILSIKANSEKNISKSTRKSIEECKLKSIAIKSDLKEDEIEADVITNMAGWCDSYMDVLIPDCWDKTIKEKGASNKQLIYHLKNHWYSTDDIIAGNVVMSSKYLDLEQFNIESDLKQGQALIGSSIVKKKYDAKCYHLYCDDEIKQHSIGLRYVKIHLCMNSDEDEHNYEKENWNKYIKYVINKEKVEGRGYFWAITEIKLLEYSAVLFGANELTTVQGTSKKEPLKNTPEEPLKDTPEQLLKAKREYLLNT
ncbi:hypothetical protein [Polaribacter aestuariivivens]|uniref:hypothetical protein n=1 Tax=Polaribacter aestuariivivens TaxID=2304626 RepID=UPI003F49AEA1